MKKAPSQNRTQTVDTLSSVFHDAFSDGVNVLVKKRKLAGNFNALARLIAREHPDQTVIYLDMVKVSHLFSKNRHRMSRNTKVAANRVLSDMKAANAAGYHTTLRLVAGTNGYGEEEVYKYHADSSDNDAGTILSCYAGPVTEGIRNEEGEKLGYGIFKAKKGAKPRRFGLGDIWRHANDHWRNPYLHRAPQEGKDVLRLLLVGGKLGPD